MPRSTDWERNLDTIVQWSPYSSEADLLLQFNLMQDQGTRIIIYNLWEDDEGQLEFDFDFDQNDIQIRGVNRDAKKIEMAKLYPNSRHFLTYRHSLRSYASILYLRIPHTFRITLRGKDVELHDLVNDLMLKEKITYRPQAVDGVLKASNMFAVVTIGFVKDAKFHIDIQGFNVYHKNRLIKPFWRVWNAAGSGGRGIVGVLEADFVQPAHDKQGFEHTNVLSRLETKLNQIQKTFWNSNRHKIGYASQHTKKLDFSASSPEFPQPSSLKDGPMSHGTEYGTSTPRFGNKLSSSQSRLHERSPLSRDDSDHEHGGHLPRQPRNGHVDHKALSSQNASQKDGSRSPPSIPQGDGNVKENHSADHISASNDTCNRLKPGPSKYDDSRIKHLEEENHELKNRINELEKSMLSQLQFERDRGTMLKAQLQELAGKQDQADKEQEALVDIFTEERTRRDKEEQLLRNRLKDSSATIQELLKKAASNTNKVKLEP
ncbi:protein MICRORCHIDIA 4-like protein [Cinnamomum micranthum f. kanehirae]|uniref:Protein MICRORCHIDIA 4-like protein n=1 Tax=Cinnamomum micranthum f. kanehirae TaxID=337451 RepID=A0A443NND7_9MAGN|nr:protein MICRORCHIDIA 4-like protein [Cinnamomum micranthum f. kanehirae]